MTSLVTTRAATAEPRALGTGGILVAGVALVVSAGTFVSEFTGFIRLGVGFAVALLLGCAVILPVTLAAADLAVSHPRIGGIYRFAQSVIRGRAGRPLGLYFSLTFLAAFLFGSAGETMAGAHALRALAGSEADAGWFLPFLVVPAVAANLCGLRCATSLTAWLLVLMLGVRWFFGLAGFAGYAATGSWDAANLLPASGGVAWSLEEMLPMLAGGFALAFWSFIGIEGTTSLVDEARDPRRSLPRGMLLGLLLILVTTIVMGLGAIGTQPRETWESLIAAGAGDAPHLAIGAAMFGQSGRLAMAAASVAATWSTLVIALAAVPRMIVAISRDGLFFGPASGFFARLHPRTGVPVRATLLVVALQTAVMLAQEAVVDSLHAATYLWLLRYLILLGLAGANRLRPAVRGVLTRTALFAIVLIGGVLIVTGWRLASAENGAELGHRAAAIMVIAGLCALAALALQPVSHRQVGPVQPGPADPVPSPVVL